jgi:DNA repair exonuclease SbcCD ATPase subunit
MEEYKKKVAEILQQPLSTDSPETVYQQTALVESLAYLAVRQATELEMKLTTLNQTLRDEKLKNLSDLTGTAMEKTIQLEAKLAPLLKEIESTEALMKYWRGVSKLIENKISLAQSVLANITSQVKAGLYLNNIK